MVPEKCPYYHRCDKYLDFMRRIDKLNETVAAKDREIERLKRELEALKSSQCGARGNPATVRPFGSSTPSSKIPVKMNSTEEARSRTGGQKAGHVGHGRVRVEEPDERIDLEKPVCPVSRAELANFQVRTRTVVHTVPARCVTRQYTIYRAWCPVCNCYHESEVPGVMPYFAFSNEFIAQY